MFSVSDVDGSSTKNLYFQFPGNADGFICNNLNLINNNARTEIRQLYSRKARKGNAVKI